MGHTATLSPEEVKELELGLLIPVVAYARISSDDKKDEHGVGDQHTLNKKTARKHGLLIVYYFTDNDRSASKAEVFREDFEEMLLVLKKGRLPTGQEVRGVVAVADDRLVRRPGDYERLVEAITTEEGRVYVDSRGPKDVYSEDVEAMGLFGAVISKIETRKMRRRQRAHHRARAEEGTPPRNGRRRFGWQDDKTHAHPVEGPLLARAAEQVAAGRSVASIANEWREKGVKTSLGNEWIANTLRVAIMNPRICGFRAIRGELVRDANGDPVVGKWDALVTPKTWYTIDALYKARRGKVVGPDGLATSDLDRRQYKYLLTGILRCGKPRPDGSLCGSRMRVTHVPKFDHHIYACLSKAQGGCGGTARKGPPVDEFVSEAVLCKLEEAASIEEEPATWSGIAEETKLQSKLDRLKLEWTTEQISDNFFFSTVRQIESRLSELRAEKQQFFAAARHSATNVMDIRRRWYGSDEEDSLDISQKRSYVKLALHAVIVHPQGRGFKPFDPDLLEPKWRDQVVLPT